MLDDNLDETFKMSDSSDQPIFLNGKFSEFRCGEKFGTICKIFRDLKGPNSFLKTFFNFS